MTSFPRARGPAPTPTRRFLTGRQILASSTTGPGHPDRGTSDRARVGHMSGICEGRVVIVTGAGRGLGREHALEFARQGADVVVNDLGGEVDGSGASIGPAQEVADAIRALGRRAIVNGDDVSDEAGAERLVNTAIEEFGRLDVLVNNAGILRDRMLTNMSFAEWDDVIRVHLRGTFATSHFAAPYWRQQST